MKEEKKKAEATKPAALANEDYTPVKDEEGRTQVANAHASGLGAMGRNDEKLPTGEETPPPQDPAY